jgi:hypothetical protein
MSFFTEADSTDKDVAALLALVVQPNPRKVFPAEIAEVRNGFNWNGNLISLNIFKIIEK